MTDPFPIAALGPRVAETGAALARALLAADPASAPASVAPLIREHRETEQAITDVQTHLHDVQPLIDRSRELDQALLDAETRWTRQRDRLNEFATPLATAIQQAVTAQEIVPDEVLQPLVNEAEAIAALREKIAQAATGSGLWERSKSQAEKLLWQGQLKLLELEHEATLREAGEGILHHSEEQLYQGPTTGDVLGKIATARTPLEAARNECLQRRDARIKFHSETAERLGLKSVRSTADLVTRQQAWTRERTAHAERLRHLPNRLIAAALDDAEFCRTNPQAAKLRNEWHQLSEIGRQRLSALQPIPPDLAARLLGEVGQRCHRPLPHPRGLPAFETPPHPPGAGVCLSAREHGLELAPTPGGGDGVIGLPFAAITEITLEQLPPSNETRPANLVTKGLMGFVTGGVRGAVMQGVGAFQEEQAARGAMPGLTLNIRLHAPPAGARNLTFRIAPPDHRELTEFFEATLPGKFRLTPAPSGS